ncbi:trans-sulfuration enzyme family protein [Effusibacillus lacus]|uniref:Cystathionine gamma-synthase n=1 Tax=Effusibacillus lacus TaxID=1348429 RepID=A0A292YLA3_9BACL|nr:PLP-dependent aspartate aminotransferase family protein [Effusibacillus lacus]TCS75252.1 cystathionine gamma-synthase [Effusibacillus lacus]GAX89691.1 cystathionine gamma-synthase [Effusibacillus lacus]
MKIETRLAQAGNRQDSATGAVSMPIHHSTTFSHPALGQSTGFDYTRTLNPTRKVLESTIADLENGTSGFAFASGMAAVSCLFELFEPGDHIVASNDLYGGTYRLLEQILKRKGLTTTYVDTGDLQAVETAVRSNTKCIFIETPTNPTMKITDIRGCSAIAKEAGAITIVDNTFMSPYFQRPLDLGADIVLHSGTKYLGGHNDVLCGLVAVKDEDLSQRLYFLQNSIGSVLGPQDCWLVVRGMKTLALRMERHNENAQLVARWLERHPLITKVYYPGLDGHPGKEVHEGQSGGYGGMLSFEVVEESMIEPILANVKLITFAESLGGVESLITYPARQTHFDIPKEVREAYGVTDRLLRFSVGIEHYQDIIEDLAQAIEAAKVGVKTNED